MHIDRNTGQRARGAAAAENPAMLHSFRFLRTAKRSQMEGGQACRLARDGRISVHSKRRHYRDYLPGGHQYGKWQL